MSFPSKTTDFNASYCLVPLVSALFYLICSTIPPMHSENDQYTTMRIFHQLTAARVREEHSPSRAASRVKMKEARKKAGDDDFSRLLCHEYSLCACSCTHTHAHACARMRTKTGSSKPCFRLWIVPESINLVPRVLRLFGQRGRRGRDAGIMAISYPESSGFLVSGGDAGRDSGIMELFKFIHWPLE